MKLCFVSFEYPPYGGLGWGYGGSGRYAEGLCSELAKMGYEIHVITPRSAGLRAHTFENGVFIHRVGFLNMAIVSYPSYQLGLIISFKRVEREVGGFDILHENASTTGFSLSGSLVKIPRVVSVGHLCLSSVKTIRPSFLERLRNVNKEINLFNGFMERIVINRTDKIIAKSKSVKKAIMSLYHIPSEKIVVIGNGVNPAEFQKPSEEEILEVKNKLGIENDPLIAFVGRPQPRKDVPTLLNAFQMLLKRVRAKLVIIGAGNQIYMNLAHSLGIDKNVVFTSFVERTTLMKLYASCDIFVLPSLLEGHSNAIMEAMASGKPIITTKNASSEVVEDGKNGILFPARNAEKLMEAMLKLLKDEKRAKEIGERNREYVLRKFSWAKVAGKTDELYRSLID